MPPRKRARVPQRSSPTPPSQRKSPASDDADTTDPVFADAWTDEEEAGLFKGLIRWKPTGIHKHFNVLALHQFLLSNGYVHPRNDHTRLSGIWRKLDALYDLDALDSREDARQLSDLSGPENEDKEDGESEDGDEFYSEAANKIHNMDFSLPDDDDFPELKWQRRLAPSKQRRDESPPVLPEINLAGEPPVRFTPSFSVEPEELDLVVPKRPRGRPKGSGKRARAMTIEAPSAKIRRSARQAGSVADTDENGGEDESIQPDVDEEGDEAEEDDDGEDQPDDDEEEEEEEEEEDGSANSSGGENEDESESDGGSADDQQGSNNTRTVRTGRKTKSHKHTATTRTSARTRHKGK